MSSTPTATRPIDANAIAECAARWAKADRILIAAGSGLSVDAGIDYSDTDDFARRFPAMVRLGFRTQYDLLGYEEWDESLRWGYLAAHVQGVRFDPPASPVYARFFELVRDRDYFVVTSNVDDLFERSGFDGSRIFAPQGSYALYQCRVGCTAETWPIEPILTHLLPAVDPLTQHVHDANLLPRCPRCDGPVAMNVRGASFVEAPYVEPRRRLESWLEAATASSLLVVEIGAGFNTPAVLRWPMERITRGHPSAFFLRVNPDFPQIPADLAERSLGIQSGAAAWVEALRSQRACQDASAHPGLEEGACRASA